MAHLPRRWRAPRCHYKSKLSIFVNGLALTPAQQFREIAHFKNLHWTVPLIGGTHGASHRNPGWRCIDQLHNLAQLQRTRQGNADSRPMAALAQLVDVVAAQPVQEMGRSSTVVTA